LFLSKPCQGLELLRTQFFSAIGLGQNLALDAQASGVFFLFDIAPMMKQCLRRN